MIIKLTEKHAVNRVKIGMDAKTALLVVTLFYSNKKDWPIDIRKLWFQCFPSENFPTDNHHNIASERSISYPIMKEKLFYCAIEYLANKIK